jgi:hypothetical protein
MLPVNKGVFKSQEMVVIVLVILAVELLEGGNCQWGVTASGIKDAYQVQH